MSILNSNCIIFIKFPYKKKSVSDIFVRIPTNSINNLMTNLCNFINKDHDISFKNFSSVSKIPYITKAKDTHNFLPWHHNIQRPIILNILSYKLSSSLPKSYSEKRSNFNNHILKNCWLCLIFFLFLCQHQQLFLCWVLGVYSFLLHHLFYHTLFLNIFYCL